jgi:hypothetical protein
MLWTLAQTNPSNGVSDSMFWLGLLSLLINAVFVPIIGALLSAIFGRLRAGDDTLKKQNDSLARLETKTERIEKDMEQAARDLKAANKDQAELEIESGGSVNELRVEIERNFLRKEEFTRFTERADRQHQEVMDALRRMDGGGQL